MNAPTEKDKEAIKKILEPQTCSIFSLISGRYEFLGSGSVVQVERVLYVCTAAHVIFHSNPQQIRIGSVLIRPQVFKIKGLRHIGGRDEDKEDLAWIEIEPPDGIVLNNIAKETDFRIELGKVSDDYIISGFPEELVEELTIGKLERTTLRHFAYITGLRPVEDWSNIYDK
jgi:hypothetical protein